MICLSSCLAPMRYANLGVSIFRRTLLEDRLLSYEQEVLDRSAETWKRNIDLGACGCA